MHDRTQQDQSSPAAPAGEERNTADPGGARPEAEAEKAATDAAKQWAERMGFMRGVNPVSRLHESPLPADNRLHRERLAERVAAEWTRILPLLALGWDARQRTQAPALVDDVVEHLVGTISDAFLALARVPWMEDPRVDDPKDVLLHGFSGGGVNIARDAANHVDQSVALAALLGDHLPDFARGAVEALGQAARVHSFFVDVEYITGDWDDAIADGVASPRVATPNGTDAAPVDPNRFATAWPEPGTYGVAHIHRPWLGSNVADHLDDEALSTYSNATMPLRVLLHQVNQAFCTYGPEWREHFPSDQFADGSAFLLLLLNQWGDAADALWEAALPAMRGGGAPLFETESAGVR